MSRKLLKWIILGIIFALIAGYAVFQSRNIFYGAELRIESPQEGFVATSSALFIRGVALRASRITLNDRQIFTDPEGYFSAETLLAPGVNIVEIEVEDRYARKKTQLLRVYYDAPEKQIKTEVTSTSTPLQ